MANSMGEKLKGLLFATRQAGKELGDGIESLRDQLRDVKNERRKLLTMPVSMDVALRRADAWVEDVLKAAGAEVLEAERFSRAEWSSPAVASPQVALGMALAAFSGDLLRQGVNLAVRRHYDDGTTSISEADRQTRLIAIDRRLLDLELAEESIIRTAEASGFPVTRRADADPRAVLAHDKVLP